MTSTLGDKNFDYQFTFDNTGPSTTLPGEEETSDIGVSISYMDGESAIFESEINPFSFTINHSNYEADIRHPLLTPPNGSNQQVDPAFVKGVKMLFVTNARQELEKLGIKGEQAQTIILHLLNPQAYELSPENLAIANKINGNVLDAVRTQANLPSSWTITSNPSTWKQLPPVAYTPTERQEILNFFDKQFKIAGGEYLDQIASRDPPILTKEQLASLRQAIETNTTPTDPEIAAHFEVILATTTEVTKNTFGLIQSWTNSVDMADGAKWTPVNLNALSPSALQTVRLSMMADSISLMIVTMGDIIKTLAADPNQEVAQQFKLHESTLSDYVKLIASVLQSLKDQLHRMQVADTERSKETVKVKFDALEHRREFGVQKTQKEEQLSNKQKTMKIFTSIVMPIVGVVVSAVSVIVSVAMTVASFGTLTPVGVGLAVAGITLGVTLMSYSIADAAMEGKLTQQVMEGLGSVIGAMTDFLCDSLVGGLEAIGVSVSESAKAALKSAVRAILIALTVVVIVAIMVAAGSGASALSTVGAATKAAAQAGAMAAQIATAAVAQVCAQILMGVIMGKSGIPALTAEILIQSNPNASDKDKMIAQIIAMIMGMLTVMVTMAAGSVGGIGNLARQAATSVSNSVSSAARSVAEAARAIANASVESIKQSLANAIKTLSRILESIKNLPADLVKSIRGTIDAFKEMSKMDLLKGMERLATLSAAGAQVVAGVYQGVIQMTVARILKEIGDLAAAEEEMKAIIKLLEKILKNIQSGLDALPEDIKEVMNSIKGMFRGASQAVDNITNSIYVPGRG